MSLCAVQAWAQTTVPGAMTADTRWTLAGSPYLVSGNLLIQNGAMLTIDAGVVVYMGAGAGLTVQAGGIRAQGSASSPIRVLSDNTRSGAPAAPGDWNQWVFNPGTVNTRLEHVLFEHGKGLTVNGSAPVFNYLDLRNHQGAAITIDLAASPSGVGNQASGNTLNGISVPAGEITGNVNWTLRGIPYVVASGTVSVGGSPAINTITPNTLQQGDTITINLTGSRLNGLAEARFDTNGLSAQILPGSTSTQATLSVTAAATATVGATVLSLLVDAGELRIPSAITVERRRPMITSLSPASLFVGQGTVDVLVNGRNFTDQSSVLVNGIALSTQFLTATQLRASVANQDAATTLLVRVRAPDPLDAGQFLFSDQVGLPVVPAQLTLSPPTLSVPKGSSRTLTLTLPYPAPAGGIAINLASSVPAVASVPATSTLPQGGTSATFDVTALNAGTTTVSASKPSFVSAQAQVTVSALCLAPPSGMISWWTGDGAANDLIGANHGVLQNGATFAAGKVGQGFSLDGIDDHVLVNHHPSLDPGAGSFSLSAWVKTNKATGKQVVISKYECGQVCLSNISSSAYFMNVADGALQAFIRHSGPADGLTLRGTKFIADNAFHHLVVVRDIGTGTLRLYVDGVLDASAPLAPDATGPLTDNDNDPDPVVIGAQVSPGQTTKEGFFAGVIDEVAIHNRALSASEISALGGAGALGMCREIVPTGSVASVTQPLSVFVPGPAQVAPSGDAMNVARPLSVFVPGPPQAAPSGDAMNVARPLSVFVPGPPQAAPSGDAMNVARPLSVFVPGPTQSAPSGDAMTVAKPLSVRMP